MSGPLGAGSRKDGGACRAAPMLIWLDVAPDGRVLSLDPMARRMLGETLGEGAVFRMAPEHGFLAALGRANRPDDPAPSVLRPPGARAAAAAAAATLVQVNVLPVTPGRVRLVLFVDPPEAQDPAPPLTPRERAVLDLLAAGLRRDRIAWRLNISLPTVDMHVRNLRRKLSAQTTSAAVASAARHGLIAP